MKKKLPLKEFLINPENGSWVSAIALTATPAIQSKLITFSADPKKVNYQKFTTNEEMKELIGIAMKANEPIYRNSEEFGEYECFFSPATIREIAQIFFKKGLANSINIEHTSMSAGAYVFQSFIVDSSKGIGSPNGLDAKDGDWVIGVKCEDDVVFEALKQVGAGFSVEGIFEMIEESFKQEQEELEQVILAYLQALSGFSKTS